MIAICEMCGWSRMQLPAACAEEFCGLADKIQRRRRDLRRDLARGLETVAVNEVRKAAERESIVVDADRLVKATFG
jgi:hypothetical protein